MFEGIRARYRAVPGVLVDGQETELRVDSSGALVTTGAGGGGAVTFTPPSSSDTGGTLDDEDTIVAAPATLLDVNGYNDSSDVRYFQLFDAVAPPADTSIPVTTVVRVPGKSNFSISFADGQGRSFAVGISWASSTTATTKTLTGAADMQVNAQYR
jgi:hypothetical protein